MDLKSESNAKMHFTRIIQDIRLLHSTLDLRKELKIEEEFFEAADVASFDASDFIFKSVKFVNCRFIQCNFTASIFAHCTFNNVKFESCSLHKSQIFESDFINCDLRNSSCVKAEIRDSNFCGNNFTHIDLSWTEITGCDLKNVILNNAKLIGSLLLKCKMFNSKKYIIQLTDGTSSQFETRFIDIDISMEGNGSEIISGQHVSDYICQKQ